MIAYVVQMLLALILLLLVGRMVLWFIHGVSGGADAEVKELRRRIGALEDSLHEMAQQNARLSEGVEFTNRLLADRAAGERVRKPEATRDE